MWDKAAPLPLGGRYCGFHSCSPHVVQKNLRKILFIHKYEFIITGVLEFVHRLEIQKSRKTTFRKLGPFRLQVVRERHLLSCAPPAPVIVVSSL
jgi:hypothetical protein